MDIMIDTTNIVLETPRLILRAFRQSDMRDFFEYASVEGVGEMAGWKHHESLADTQRVLDMFLAEKNIFALEYKETGKVIGSFGLHNAHLDGTEYALLRAKEIGYVLSKDYWGRGLMCEAVAAVLRFCFETLGTELVTVGHFEDNVQSRRVIEKSGFSFYRMYDSKKHGKNVLEYTYFSEDFFQKTLDKKCLL